MADFDMSILLDVVCAQPWLPQNAKTATRLTFVIIFPLDNIGVFLLADRIFTLDGIGMG
jgi:hypothetical protein